MPINSDLLYDFYHGLSGRYADLDSLMEAALPVIAGYMGADNIFFFTWNSENSIISQRMMCAGGEIYYLQEDIFVDESSPEVIKFLQNGIGYSPTLDYPALYVLLKWRTPLNSLKTLESGEATRSQYGVLRLERLKKNKIFTKGERETMLAVARELGVKMNMVVIDQYNTRQLRRANALNNLTQVFATSIRLNDSLEQILKNVQSSFGFDRTSLFLNDAATGDMREAFEADLSGEVRQLTKGDAAWRDSCARCPKDGVTCPAGGSSGVSLTLPLKVQNKKMGCLVFDNVLSRRRFEQEDILSLKQFSAHIALAIDNARLFEKVKELSNYDELTQLPLRRFFNESFAKEIYRSQRFNLTFSFILLDIDHFKEINDKYGHVFGDEALKAVSGVIRESLRQTDIPCRFGGDEVAILLPRTTGEEAVNISKRISERIAAIKLPENLTRGEEIKLSISQGIAVFPYDGDEQGELVKRADEALYYVKGHGRGSWALYGDISGKK